MLGRRSFILFLSKMISAALAYVGLYFITRYLETDIYGTVTAAMALVATFNAVSDLGFSSAHIKRVSEGADPNQCISTFAFIKVVLTGLMVLITMVSIFVWTTVMGNVLSGTSMQIIFLFILYQVLYDLSSIATVTFQARMEMAKMPLATLVEPLVRVPLVIFVALNYMGVMELTMSYLVGSAVVFIVSMYMLLRERIKWTRPVLLRSYYTFALPLIIITVISAVSGSADKLLITFFWNPTDVGLYAAPAVFLGVFATISTAVSTLTFPSFSKLHKDGNLVEIRSLSKQAERYIAMIGLPVTILIMMFPYEVCEVLLGPKYIDSGRAIGIMVATTFITMINAVHSSQIVAVGRPDISARITIVTVIMNISLMLLFIPGFGLGLSFVGAALALLIGNFVSLLMVRYSVYRLTGTVPNVRLAYQLLAGLAAAGAMFVLDLFISIDRFYTLIIFGLVAYAAFLLVLAALKEFTRMDVKYFLDLINVKKMFSYVGGELKGK
ncbi:MAG TPA: flippase [Methanomassiliicoccales archaeon]|nr:flippase [Methanomassiliicoccales archaeon]